MKKANTIIALVAIAGFSFAATLSNGMNLNKDMKLSMNTAEDVYGVQFDMRYNPDHINVEELLSEIKYRYKFSKEIDLNWKEIFSGKTLLKNSFKREKTVTDKLNKVLMLNGPLQKKIDEIKKKLEEAGAEVELA